MDRKKVHKLRNDTYSPGMAGFKFDKTKSTDYNNKNV